MQAHLSALLFLIALLQFSAACAKDAEPEEVETAPENTVELPKRFPVQIAGRWGFMDASGTLVIDALYEDVKLEIARRIPMYADDIEPRYASSQHIPVKLDDRWGYIDFNGRTVVPIRYDTATHYSDGIGVVTQNGNIFLLNEQGVAINRPDRIPLEQAHVFCEGRLPVRTRGHWVYDKKSDAMQPSDKWGFFGQDGGVAVKPLYDIVLSFSSGLAPVNTDGQWGYVNHDGKEIIANKYEKADYFFNGFAKVKMDGKEGAITSDGTLKVENLYEEVGRAADTHIPVKLNGKWGYLDYNAHMVIEPQFAAAQRFSREKAAVAMPNPHNEQDLQWGFIDLKGEWLAKPEYEEVRPFPTPPAPLHVTRGSAKKKTLHSVTIMPVVLPNTLAAVKKEGKWGFINEKGELAIPLQFDEAQVFFEGLARVKVEDKWGYINTKGEWVWKPTK